MSGKQENNNDFTGREIIISRLMNAPVELVWEVWTKPEHIKNWWGPAGFTDTIASMEVKPGGRWQHTLHGPDGTDYPNLIEYKKVVKHQLLVFEYLSKPWHLTTVTFKAEGKKTLITWHMAFESKEEFEWIIKNHKADKGLEQNFEKMEVYLAASQQSIIIERVYNAPIDKVWNAISNINEMRQWYFALPDFKPEAGFEFSFDKVKDDKTLRHLFKVTEVVAGKKLAYSWRYDGYPGNSLVCWELFAEGDKTKVVLTHSGVETFPAGSHFDKGNFVAGWTEMLETRLKNHLERTS